MVRGAHQHESCTGAHTSGGVEGDTHSNMRGEGMLIARLTRVSEALGTTTRRVSKRHSPPCPVMRGAGIAEGT